MSKCIYDLSEDCNNTDCLDCVLDKIRAEIWDLQYGDEEKSMTDEDRADAYNNAIRQVIEIIDKYKSESEDKQVGCIYDEPLEPYICEADWNCKGCPNWRDEKADKEESEGKK